MTTNIIQEYGFFIVLIVVMGGMMWWSQRQNKKRSEQVKQFRAGLQPGTEIITIGQIIGKIVSVDEQYEEVVIDSEGTKLRLGFNAISREYVRPAYVSDDEVDENGNPIAEADSQADVQAAGADDAQVNVETSVAANNADADNGKAGKASDEESK
ncbi:preprotein translocase subunit YajC [Bifidobacterium rousetti]|uniref:preprotein translocase subunit YajC n=1 Tax=Bifidobacterium rousetti TaxID=2045439 RepID=UPI00123A9CE3|nr:preprotein translocase subunit YajC [Bifidobacterium rousetti]KAA8816741.1 preprotein translocase subunit YajC [Bifidobacterium rousetti]